MNRTQANDQYKLAVSARRALESCTDKDFSEEDFEKAYTKALETESVARSVLVAAEIAEPTKSEKIRANNKAYLRNRGYDI